MADTNRRADATLFGYDFQVNAAIILFLENIKDVESLRLEGGEDIDIKLNDGYKILAQAKAVQRPREDFNHVRENLKKSLQSLSEACHKNQVKKLIFITNSPNPFHERNFSFYGPTWRSFFDLTEKEQTIVKKYLEKIKNPLDTSAFYLQIFPFETDDEREKYKYVQKQIDDFLLEIDVNRNVLGKEIMSLWQNNVFRSGTKKCEDITLKKEEIIWPLIAKVIDTDKVPEKLLDEQDDAVQEEVLRNYRALIHNKVEDFSTTMHILADYHMFRPVTGKGKDKCLDFVNCKWEDYQNEFQVPEFDEEIKETLIKTVLYLVVKNRIKIKHIKEGVNLCG